MRIACLQLHPISRAVATNISRATRLLSEYQPPIEPGHLDMLLLPEMAFTGYIFRDRSDIAPFLEAPEDLTRSPSLQWASATAKRLACYLAVGYADRAGPYNSVALFGRSGELVRTYHKSFLYYFDETWAIEGPGFSTFSLPGLGTCGLGICMDINPYRFEADVEAKEFANFHREKNTRWVLAIMNWLEIPEELGGDGRHEEAQTLSYWQSRFSPLRGENVGVVICNRGGVEHGWEFAGCTCVLDMKTGTIVSRLGAQDEGLLVVNHDLGTEE